LRNGPLTLDEVFDRIAETLNLPEEANGLFESFSACGVIAEAGPVIDLSPTEERVEDGHVYRVSVNDPESGETLATAVFQTEEQGHQTIDLLLLLQELNEFGLE
jgi:hypothetical protein